MNEENNNLSVKSFFADREKWEADFATKCDEREVERKQKEKDENQKKIGDLTSGELKTLIRTVVREESTSGDLPLFNRNQKKKVERWIWKSVIAAMLCGSLYFTFWYESEYQLLVSSDKLFVSKRRGWFVEEKEIKFFNSKWQLCSANVEQESCSVIFTPFEAKSTNTHKFIFVGGGKVFLVSNDKTEVSGVKLINGSWSLQNRYDEWTAFDSMYDGSQDNEPYDPR